jgi:trigger factor
MRRGSRLRLAYGRKSKGQERMVKVEVKEEEKWKRTLEVELPPEKVRQKREEVVSELAKKVSVPGFRKGKAPRDLIERRYKDSIKAEFYEKALAFAYREALQETSLRPVTDPTFGDVTYVEGGPLKFKATVEVMPEVDLDVSGLAGLEIVGDVYEVGEAEVKADLDKIRDAHAVFESVDRPAATGDYLVIDYQSVDPETGARTGEKHADFALELGAASLLPEFSEALSGASAGDEKRVDVDYPAGFANKELAGKKVSYAVEIKEIREKRLPELDDKFARRVSEYVTLDQLKARVADNLKAQEAVESRRRLEEKLVDALIARHPFDPPESIVASLGKHFVESMTQGSELSEEEKRDLERRYRPQVVRKVQRDLLLDLIAEREGVEVGDREVGAEIRRMKETGELRPAVNETELAERIRDRLRAKKTLDLLMDRADVKLEARPRPQEQGR